MLCADLVDIRWKDQGGRTRRGVANLEDISLSGACLQVDRAVLLGADLWISYPNGELVGTVKYCVFREIGYFLGVEFHPSNQWSQLSFKPQHMLDPRRLLSNGRSTPDQDTPVDTKTAPH
jgi:hypothetical protein